MNIAEQYLALARADRWSEALPLIEEILQRAPGIETSWFNYGVCLDALGRQSEAADKFIQAYAMNPEHLGALYRAFRSLFLAQDYEKFLKYAQQQCATDPGLIDNLLEDQDFSTLFTRPEFIALKLDCELRKHRQSRPT